MPKRQLTAGGRLPEICPAVQLSEWASSTARPELDRPGVHFLPFRDVAVAQTYRASMNAAGRLSFPRFDHPLVPNFCPAVALHAGRLLGSDRRLGAVFLFPLSGGTYADEVHRHRPWTCLLSTMVLDCSIFLTEQDAWNSSHVSMMHPYIHVPVTKSTVLSEAPH